MKTRFIIRMKIKMKFFDIRTRLRIKRKASMRSWVKARFIMKMKAKKMKIKAKMKL